MDTGQMDSWMDGWVVGWMDGYGWIDGWIDGWMKRWMDVFSILNQAYTCLIRIRKTDELRAIDESL